jgi:hypothetical protein
VRVIRRNQDATESEYRSTTTPTSGVEHREPTSCSSTETRSSFPTEATSDETSDLHHSVRGLRRLAGWAADLEFSANGEVEYDDNVFRSQSEQAGRRAVPTAAGVRVYEDRGDDLNYSVGYQAPIEFSTRVHSDLNDVDHIGSATSTTTSTIASMSSATTPTATCAARCATRASTPTRCALARARSSSPTSATA